VSKIIKNKIKRNLDDFLEIIGNPTRRSILSKISKVPLSIAELAKVLNISRQAVHSQIEVLKIFDLIEEVDILNKRGKGYKIKDNISLSIDISPNYFNIKHNLEKESENLIKTQFSEICADLEGLKDESEKIHYLGSEIKKIDKQLRDFDEKRNQLIIRKECLLRQIKKNLEKSYKDELGEYKNQSTEILTTFFFNTDKFFGRFSIEELIDEMFFQEIPRIQRAQNKLSVKILLEDMSKLMDFLWKEDENDWFFDF